MWYNLATYEVDMELYHAMNRGVEKRQIFLDTQDRVRFVHNLFICNDKRPVTNAGYYGISFPIDLRGRYGKREQLVDIHAWVLMGNHYHLLLSEKIDGGLSKFIMKLNVAYAKYFNEKYQRSGTLFQSRTKKVLIERDAHFLHILNYIHLNPLDFLKNSRGWRRGEIVGARGALDHLEKYRWSSYLDYCGKSNFPEVITCDLFANIFKDYRKEVYEYIKDIDTAIVSDYALE